MEVIMFLLFGFGFVVLYPAFVFLLAPVIIALTGKKFKKKTLRIITIINGLCGLFWFVLFFMNSVFTPTAIAFYIISAFIWSFAAYAILKRASGIDSKYLEYDPNRIVECKSCGHRSEKFFNACPNCGNYAKRYVCLNEETTEYNHCCSSCGEKYSYGDSFCCKCGAKITQN